MKYAFFSVLAIAAGIGGAMLYNKIKDVVIDITPTPGTVGTTNMNPAEIANVTDQILTSGGFYNPFG